MSPHLTEAYARKIAARIGPVVGFDPFTIIMVLCSLLGLLMQCWTFHYPTQAEMHAALVAECQDPKRKERLIRRAARQFRRKSETPLTEDQAITLAEASVEEALETPPEEFMSYATACGSLSETDRTYFQQEPDDGEV